MQMGVVLKNQTGIENWIQQKAEMRQEEMGTNDWVYPYDLGRSRNFRMVFCDPTGNGMEWPVVSGCDQYTLTVSARETCFREMARDLVEVDEVCFAIHKARLVSDRIPGSDPDRRQR